MPTAAELANRYRASSDLEVADAYALGAEAFTDEAWQIVKAEFERRELCLPVISDSPTVDARPSDKPELRGSPELSESARDGQRQLYAIVAISLAVSGISTAFVFLNLGIARSFRSVVSFAITLSLCVKLLEGRSWARWLTAAFNGVGGFAGIVISRELGALNRFASLVVSIMAIGFLAMCLVLIFSRSISAFMAESRTLHGREANH